MFSKGNWARFGKAAVGLVGVVAEVESTHVLTGTAERVAVGIVAVATAFGIYHVPYVPKAGPGAE